MGHCQKCSFMQVIKLKIYQRSVNFRSKFSCSYLNQKTNDFFLFLLQPLKMDQIKKMKALCYIKQGVFNILDTCIFRSVGQKSNLILFVFWFKLEQEKLLLKFTDLQHIKIMKLHSASLHNYFCTKNKLNLKLSVFVFPVAFEKWGDFTEAST